MRAPNTKREKFTKDVLSQIEKGLFDGENGQDKLGRKIFVFRKKSEDSFSSEEQFLAWQQQFFNKLYSRKQQLSEAETATVESAIKAVPEQPKTDQTHQSVAQVPLNQSHFFNEQATGRIGVTECRAKSHKLLFERRNSAYKITAEEGILAALEDAHARARKGIGVLGDDDFKLKIAKVAASQPIAFVFLDPEMQKMVQEEKAKLSNQPATSPEVDSEIATFTAA